MKQIKKIGIVGSGIMGQGIAIVAAQSGFDVLVYDENIACAKEGFKKISAFLNSAVTRGKISQDRKQEILSKIKKAVTLEELKDRDLVIEAIIEDLRVKIGLFKKLDVICAPKTIFTSNTSSISIDKLARSTKRADKFAGMHFMNPAPLIDVVEVIKGKKTASRTIIEIKKTAELMGKKPILINDAPGFILNRLLIPMINEAAYCLQSGIASKEDIDQIMKLGAKHPMGPLELADLIGLDTCLLIMQELKTGFKNSKYKPCPLLEKMVKEKKLGRKTKKGFYKYA